MSNLRNWSGVVKPKRFCVLRLCSGGDRDILDCLMPGAPPLPPWSVEEYNSACFIVRNNNGQQLAYVYFEEEPGRRSAAKLLSKDEA
jgi:hypothetical protein